MKYLFQGSCIEHNDFVLPHLQTSLNANGQIVLSPAVACEQLISITWHNFDAKALYVMVNLLKQSRGQHHDDIAVY